MTGSGLVAHYPMTRVLYAVADAVAGAVVILGLPVAVALDLFDNLTGRWGRQ